MVKERSEIQKPGPAKDTITPLMQQYREIKSRYPGMILFFRLGDFYEMFGDDALKASKILEVVLTQRQGIPMCGVPYHAVNAYLKKLVKAGEKVAICEQLEEPGAGRGIVRRGVVRVITPGTLLEDNLLEANQNNYLLSLFPSENFDSFGAAFVDVSTGEFGCTEVSRDALSDEIFRLSPGEIVIPKTRIANPFFVSLEQKTGLAASAVDDWSFLYGEAEARIKEIFRLQSLKPFGLEGKTLAVGAVGGVLAYLEKTQVGQLPPFSGIRFYSLEKYLDLDETAIRNLELIEGTGSLAAGNSLREAIDTTLTSMGGRLLRQWILQPLLSPRDIVSRQNAVQYFFEKGLERRNVRELLKGVADLERIVSRLASGTATAREVVSLKNSLARLPRLRENLAAGDALSALPDTIAALDARLVPPQEVIGLIAAAIVEEPPITLKEGGIIREGFNTELDELRTVSRDAKSLISGLESRERQRTGINTLKIGYTSVFGYYLELSRTNLHLAPPDYLRKQTLANAERFITPELKTLEEKILSAEEKRLRLEEALFKEVRERILSFTPLLQRISSALAELDIFCSFAETAALYNYSRPQIDDSHELLIKEGRHPVIERKLKSGSFVANDAFLNGVSDQIILLTGPNMAGKSTYLRQVALIVILAQTGSFVPAQEARIGIVDRIFTRIGAGDNLAKGESTFMVEMHETAHILNQNTSRSLIILDEVGRGTSTYDGISIAWAVVEHLSRRKETAGPKVLFATHYFELTELARLFPGIKNCNVAVKEWQGEVLFLHKIVAGAADRSYGIHVAQLAGLPREVITRAYAILETLEQKADEGAPERRDAQMDLFAARPPETASASILSQILIELSDIDPNTLTPLEALQRIAQWKKRIETQ